jgi:hypothetical protein
MDDDKDDKSILEKFSLPHEQAVGVVSSDESPDRCQANLGKAAYRVHVQRRSVTQA